VRRLGSGLAGRLGPCPFDAPPLYSNVWDELLKAVVAAKVVFSPGSIDDVACFLPWIDEVAAFRRVSFCPHVFLLGMLMTWP